MSPTLLLTAALGVLAVVWLTSLLWGSQMEPLGEEGILLEQIKHEYPSFLVSDLLIAADRLTGLAYDDAGKQAILCYSHGIYSNRKPLRKPEFEAITWADANDGYLIVTLHFQAYDRREYKMKFSAAQRPEVQRWLERLLPLCSNPPSLPALLTKP